MNRGNGSIVGTLNTPTSSAASGSFSLYQIQVLDKAGQWPSYIVVDPYWPYVTALLPGTGANGGTNNTFVDSSSFNAALTRFNTLTQGTFNPYSPTYSVFFDGTGDSLTVASNAAFQLGTGDFTFETWIYPTALGVNNKNNIINIGTFSTGLMLRVNGTTTGLQVFILGTQVVATTTGLTANNWNHVALVRNGSACTIYINGAVNGTFTDSSNISPATATVTIGTAAHTTGEDFTGYMSNYRLVKGTAVYTAAFTPPTTPLTAIANTSLLTCQSNRFNDNSTNNFAITRNGNVSIQAFQPFNFTVPYAAGTMGGSSRSNGSNDYLQTTSALSQLNPAGGDFTIEFWVYPTASSRQDWFNLQATNNRITIFYNTGVVNYATSVSGAAATRISYSITAANLIDTWHHVAVCRSGSNTRMFFNGVQVGSTYTTLDTFFSDLQLTLMRDPNGSTYAAGYMSNFRMLKGTALYTTTFTPPATPLTAVANTSILLNFTNGAVIDNAITNDCVTIDTTQISTAQSKFGAGSIAFDGTNDYLSFPASRGYDFASGDWTVECWVYFSSVANAPHIWQIGSAAGTRFNLFLTGGVLNVYSSGTTVLASLTPLSTGQWYHLAVTYVAASTATRLFIDGTLNTSTSSYSAFPKNSGTLTLALGWQPYAGAAGDYLNGYMNDFRITKGVARYTSSFTPPGTPFPTA